MKKTEKQAVMVLPAHQQHSRITLLCALGYFFRCVLAFACAYGFSRFIFDSLDAKILAGPIFYTCVIGSALFAIMQKNNKLFFGGAVLIAAAITFTVKLYGGITNTFKGAYVAFCNAWLTRLSELGFTSIKRQIIDISAATDDLTKTEQEMFSLSAVILTFLICAMFVLLISNKVHLLPLIFTVSAASSFIFYFGMCESTFGFSLMLSAFCGCISLSRYDAVFAKRKLVCSALGTTGNSRAAIREVNHTIGINSALGGFCGIAAAAIAFLIILIPSRFSVEMYDIPAVSEPIYIIENRLAAMLSGYSPYETGLYAADSRANDPRSTVATERNHSGKLRFKVESDTDLPIYLRSWVGIAYKSDSWLTADSNQIETYRDTFGKGFSPELLTAELLTAVDPSLTHLENENCVSPHPELGYTAARVHVEKLTSQNTALYLPSFTDPRIGLLKYGSTDKHSASYVNYYEGIFSANSIIAPKKYSVVSLLGHTPDEYSITGMTELVRHYNEQYALIMPLRVLLADGASESELRKAYEQLTEEMSLSYYSSSISADQVHSTDTVSKYRVYTPPSGTETLSYRYVYKMSDAERNDIHALIDNLHIYDEYVQSTYLGSCEGYGRFIDLMYDIASKAYLSLDTANYTYLDTHRAVEAVINYLSSNIIYNLSPIEPQKYRTYYNAAESFLFDTRQGYCVQYATAAAMLLRVMDIPVRYAEGYIVTHFEANGNRNGVGSRIAEVPDSNAHAWIEVYYEGYGWVSYEVTSPFVEAADNNTNRDDRYDAETTTEKDDHLETTEAAKSSETTGQDETTELRDEIADTNSAVSHEDAETKSPSDSEDSVSINKPSSGISLAVVAVTGCAVIFAVLAISLIILRHRATASESRRRLLIRTACSNGVSRSQALECSSAMSDSIMRILKLFGLSPMIGEQASEFAARVDNSLSQSLGKKFSDVIPALQAGEFADAVTDSELRLIAEYFDELYIYAASKCGRIKAIYVKYFLLVS